jgi:hypothetical protein
MDDTGNGRPESSKAAVRAPETLGVGSGVGVTASARQLGINCFVFRLPEIGAEYVTILHGHRIVDHSKSPRARP